MTDNLLKLLGDIGAGTSRHQSAADPSAEIMRLASDPLLLHAYIHEARRSRSDSDNPQSPDDWKSVANAAWHVPVQATPDGSKQYPWRINVLMNSGPLTVASLRPVPFLASDDDVREAISDQRNEIPSPPSSCSGAKSTGSIFGGILGLLGLLVAVVLFMGRLPGL